MADDAVFNPDKARRLNDAGRLETQVGKETLARLLDLRGTEDIADLGSGTGFYTDIVAGLTSGLVYAVEFQSEMIDAYRERGVPGNVRLVPGDIRRLPLPEDSLDVAYSIAVYHETRGDLGLPSLLPALRSSGRLVIIDWRGDPETWESGPPAILRFDKEDVAASLRPFFQTVTAENVGRYMFAVVAERKSSENP
jgi:SAM-dependent methyltransferase